MVSEAERYAIVDASTAPIVYVRVVAEPTDAGYRRYLDDIGAAFRALDRFALIFDTGSLNRFPARYREMMSRWLAETEEEFRGRWICAAFVIQSRLIRGVLTTMYWVKPPYYEHKVVARLDDAWTWTRERLARAGVAPSDDG